VLVSLRDGTTWLAETEDTGYIEHPGRVKSRHVTGYKTDQEAFWAGEFGDAYTERNTGDNWIAANTALLAQVLRRTHDVQSVLEVGANIGLNLRALASLLPEVQMEALEINPKAVADLRRWGRCSVTEGSILDFQPVRTFDLVFTKGVLIHINPEVLPAVYEKLVAASSRYVLVTEYYNPTPTAIPYRGHSERLFKRDFAGELIDRHSLTLVDYGFVYHRDQHFPQDDLTWFLMEKSVEAGSMSPAASSWAGCVATQDPLTLPMVTKVDDPGA
jgi:pseudaminic acid biosynthesis-associated methylase